jgi:hypothetical protein
MGKKGFAIGHTSGVLLVCYLLLAWVDWRLLARRLPVRARQKQFSAREQEQQEQAKQRKWEWEMKHDERGPPRIAWCSAQQQQQAAADRTHTAAAAAAASAAAAAAAGQQGTRKPSSARKKRFCLLFLPLGCMFFIKTQFGGPGAG